MAWRSCAELSEGRGPELVVRVYEASRRADRRFTKGRDITGFAYLEKRFNQDRLNVTSEGCMQKILCFDYQQTRGLFLGIIEVAEVEKSQLQAVVLTSRRKRFWTNTGTGCDFCPML
jgi:hypothetical protein